MGIFSLITVAWAFFYLLRRIHLRKRKQDTGEQFIRWGLSVDNCYFYSQPFIVTNQCITIIGFQEIDDNKSPIFYSVVKMSWWGKRTVYAHCLIHGNFKDTKGFQITMENIPNGEDYKIEVFSRYRMALGRFQLR
ncbi:hypothetical protein [Schinkia azotoformans]|uniref:hypothetical protein n=1 Tax=Schinkia azotoformans TaxID=1454 RepID=UPI002DB74E3C|nr:hypothetical protein [Schinkia azotoformans]MEC1716306.1 hypothetical protein [Schinkia azotoformans]MEC1741683.1 hypothetical protein [Schinkia azotoformans]MEC1745705.1 hypothetical protein [Schinkia azotoformans]MEC1758925.1 hypothetical protein [Schinkia azotoformans]MEC1766903.1 hypothetical protein [Schinkia azotoformans]